MAKRWINLAGDDLERWDNTPLLERKMVVSKAFQRHYDTENFDVEKAQLKLKKLVEKKELLEKIGGLVEDLDSDLWEEIVGIELKLESLEDPARGYSIPSIDPNQFWDTFLESAKRHLDEDICFDSPGQQDAYRIEGIVDSKNGKKVLVERIFSKSDKPSTFTKATVEKAISRLKSWGGEDIPIGEFMPVMAQECAMVEIHPGLRRDAEFIYYDHEVIS